MAKGSEVKGTDFEATDPTLSKFSDPDITGVLTCKIYWATTAEERTKIGGAGVETTVLTNDCSPDESDVFAAWSLL